MSMQNNVKQIITEYGTECKMVMVGIETERELQVSKKLGLHFGQGYYWEDPNH